MSIYLVKIIYNGLYATVFLLTQILHLNKLDFNGINASLFFFIRNSLLSVLCLLMYSLC